jgi:hypothetical protein
MTGIDAFIKYLITADSDRIAKSHIHTLLSPPELLFFIKNKILIPDTFQEITCPKCGIETIEVSLDENRSSFGLCGSADCGVVKLKKEDVVVYNVNITLFIETMAKQLKLTGGNGIVPDLRLWHVGRCTVKNIYYVVFLLTEPPSDKVVQALRNMNDAGETQIVFTSSNMLHLKPTDFEAKFISIGTIFDGNSSEVFFSSTKLYELMGAKISGFTLDVQTRTLSYNQRPIIKYQKEAQPFKMLCALWSAESVGISYLQLYFTVTKTTASQPIASRACHHWKNDILAHTTDAKYKPAVNKLITIQNGKSSQAGYKLDKNIKVK